MPPQGQVAPLQEQELWICVCPSKQFGETTAFTFPSPHGEATASQDTVLGPKDMWAEG